MPEDEATFTAEEVLDEVDNLRRDLAENRALIVARRESIRTWELVAAAVAVMLAVVCAAILFVVVYLNPITDSLNESDKKQNASDVRVELILNRQACLGAANAHTWQALPDLLATPTNTEERLDQVAKLREVALEFGECA
jgi:ABC-type uncharacterized transport system permease subunit